MSEADDFNTASEAAYMGRPADLVIETAFGQLRLWESAKADHPKGFAVIWSTETVPNPFWPPEAGRKGT